MPNNRNNIHATPGFEVLGNEKDLSFGKGVKTIPDGKRYEGTWRSVKNNMFLKTFTLN